MKSLICQNSTRQVISELDKYCNEGGTIGGLSLVDATADQNQVVIIVHDEPISNEIATVWWDGYKTCLTQAGLSSDGSTAKGTH